MQWYCTLSRWAKETRTSPLQGRGGALSLLEPSSMCRVVLHGRMMRIGSLRHVPCATAAAKYTRPNDQEYMGGQA